MKTAVRRMNLFAASFFVFISIPGMPATAEERRDTPSGAIRQEPRKDAVESPREAPASGASDDAAPMPSRKAKKPRRPAAPPPEPPWTEEEDGHDGHHHHCFGWFHNHRRGPDEGARKHDGLFFRLAIGPGFGSYQGTGVATAPVSVGEIRDPSGDGTKVGGSISLGGAVGDNLILHGDLWFNGNSPRQRPNAFVEFGTGAFGGGLTYYFMPQNIFVSGAVGLVSSWLVIVDPDTADDDWDGRGRHRMPDGLNVGTGIGAYLTVGKEWWVSDNWALGAALQGDYAHTQGQNLDFNYSGIKVLFTATFN